jgi:hypothetical protein
MQITFDGHSRTVGLRSARSCTRQMLYVGRVHPGRHRLTIRALSGTVAVEGLAIGSVSA